jgi:hypothetical protein
MTVADDSQTVRLRQVGRWQLKAEGVKMVETDKVTIEHAEKPTDN